MYKTGGREKGHTNNADITTTPKRGALDHVRSIAGE